MHLGHTGTDHRNIWTEFISGVKLNRE